MGEVVHAPKTWVKIRREGENFWLGEIRTENGVKTGAVDNCLIVAPYKFGQRIEFEDGEVIDVMAAKKGEKYEP